jgi:hypothetical protein
VGDEGRRTVESLDEAKAAAELVRGAADSFNEALKTAHNEGISLRVSVADRRGDCPQVEVSAWLPLDNR